jgi:outer membrane beta-barrel protein
MHQRKLHLELSLVYFLQLLCSLVCTLAFATDEVPKIIAVQNRTYYLSDEITVQAGYLPLDSFTKYFSFGGSYTHFYNDFLGWEVVNGEYAQPLDTGLSNDLVSRFGATAIKGDVLQYYLTTNAIYTPLYTKNLIFNRSILSGETSLVGGLGYSKFDSGSANTFDLGIVFRLIMGKSSSLKFDVREYVYLTTLDTKTNLMVMLGYSYSLGKTERKSSDGSASKDVDD